MNPASILCALKKRRQTNRSAKDRRRFRPSLDLLEDRLAPANYDVVNTNADGNGSLLFAISVANSHPGPDTITFNIPGPPGIKTITPNHDLPTLTDTVTIEGTTLGGLPQIELNGSLAGPGANGLVMKKAGSVVRSLIINNFEGNGILVLGSKSVVEGCFIGTDNTGFVAAPNKSNGVLIAGTATGVRIGSTVLGLGNVISGNALSGVAIQGSMTKKNLVQGNFIGTNRLDNGPVNNLIDGVTISGGSQNNVVGGTVAGAGNVIACNNGDGVGISGYFTTGNRVQGNIIGTTLTGMAGMGNDHDGVAITDSRKNTVGGTVAGARNLISGNHSYGVEISGFFPTGNMVQGNLVGTNAAGTAILANKYGIGVLGGYKNTVGGTLTGSGNVISGNLKGVIVSGPDTMLNSVLGNFIGTDVTGMVDLGNILGGVVIQAGAAKNTVGSTVAGARNVISGNNSSGVEITGPGTAKNKVQGNFIGTNAIGTGDLGNTIHGVLIDTGAAENIMGGTVAAARNIISGNDSNGVQLTDADTKLNLVEGNFIGTDVTGTVDLGNSVNGVAILAGAAQNTVGGIVAGARNVISGNNIEGVVISDVGTTNNMLLGNYIGTNASGSGDLGNGFDGVNIQFGADNTAGAPTFVGMDVKFAPNVISGNDRCGLFVWEGATGSYIVKNLIGLAADGKSALPNSRHGVCVVKNAFNNEILGNRIAFNGGDGVLVGSDPAIFFVVTAGAGNVVVDNSIYSNVGLGIDLGPNDGVTPNDPNDGDAGPNDLLNTPTITSAVRSGNSLLITGFMNTEAGKIIGIEFFDNKTGGQGQTPLGTNFTYLQMGPDNTVFFSVKLTVPASVVKGDKLTAIAVDLNTGSTSEFSMPVTIE